MNTTPTLRRLAALATISTALVGAGGCGFFNNLRAKDTLNNGVREFNKGHYEVAEKLFKEALDYDPDNGNARMFYAMTLNAELKRQTSEDLGKRTIAAYEDVLKGTPSKEQQDKANAFIADVYKIVGDSFDPETDAAKIQEYHDKRREWLLKRAQSPGQSDETQGQMLYAVGQSYWEEANAIVKSFEKRSANPQEAPTYPMPPEKHDQVIALINKSHEYMQQAVAKSPNYADAYAYEKILFTLESKITDDKAKHDELLEKARQAEEKFREVNSANQAAAASAAGDASNTNSAGQ